MTRQQKEYGFAVAVVAVCTVVCFTMFRHFELTNLVMVYLIGTLAVAARGHRGPAAFYAVSSVLCFDFFFVPPRFTFSVSDAQYIWTFAVMFATAMTISHLTIRLREEAAAARQGEERSAWLMEKAKKAELDAEAERMRSALLSSVSHDLRTPLTAIVGSASALLEKEELSKSSKTRELLENIQSEGERLSHLVQNLLETTRLESGEIRLQKEMYPFEEVAESVLDRLKKVLQGRKVKIVIPENLPLVPMDATLIEQVLMNLLENALRHTPAQAALEVSAAVEGEAVAVAVADRGPGLKADELERVFDKFTMTALRRARDWA
jgi:K+-sensing histidine kinase KdpD